MNTITLDTEVTYELVQSFPVDKITTITIDEHHTVEIDKTGDSIYLVVFQKDGELHRDGDKPAVIWFRSKTGSKALEVHYIDGKPHRENDLPALIEWADDGAVRREERHTNGEYNSSNSPSVKEFHKNGGTLEMWHENGVLHRVGAPAITHTTKFTKTEEYIENGKKIKVVTTKTTFS